MTTTTTRIFNSIEEAEAAKAKGSDLIREACGRCGGDGVVHYGRVSWDNGLHSERWCFWCNGAKSTTVQVKSVRARLRREAKAAAETKAREAIWEQEREAKDAWKAANPEAWALITEMADKERQSGLAFDLWNSRTYIPTTEELAQLTQAKADKDAEEAARTEVVTGTQTIEGEVLAVKETEGYGYNSIHLKMLVKDDRGFKVYGTLPQALYEASRGDRVRFTANVSASERDFDFGFFSRPRKAEVLA